MTTPLNYDSRGLQTGLDVGGITSDFQIQLIVNRRKVFENALKAKGDFRLNVFLQLPEFQAANAEEARKTLAQLAELTQSNFKETAAAGAKQIDDSLKDYVKRGYRPHDKPKTGVISILDISIIATVSAFSEALAQSQSVIYNQTQAIAGLLNGENITRQDIDMAQASYLAEGITVNGNIGNAKELTAYSEFIMRNDSQQLLLKAEGERAADYNVRYAQISAHPSSCKLCVPWQNKIVVNDTFAGGIPDGKTPLMSEAIDAGLFHINCRHTYSPYIPGYDKLNLYKKDTATKEETAKRYAIEQQQRYNERGIREWKIREAAALSERAKLNAAAKVEEWQAKQQALRKIAEQESIPFYRQYSREQIGGKTIPTDTLKYLSSILSA